MDQTIFPASAADVAGGPFAQHTLGRINDAGAARCRADETTCLQCLERLANGAGGHLNERRDLPVGGVEH